MTAAPGKIRDAIISYMEALDGEASLKQISEAVSIKLGLVVQSSIRSYLNNNVGPVFERTRFLHLRVSSNAFGQLTASDPAEAHHLDYYKRMWTACFEGFLRSAGWGDYIAVHPELLPARAHYPKMVRGPDGEWREESDRWTESAFLIEVARDCFAKARAAVPGLVEV